MPAEYLIRLDDACPTMDHARWSAIEGIIVRHGIRPIVAIVPDNADPDLMRCPADAGFWERARSWGSLSWSIALHGHRHQLRPSRRGLVAISTKAEFTGLPWVEQRRRIREGVRILEGHGVRPEVWVAPAHGFDLATLQALREESTIRIISDGFSRRANLHLGFTWLPQQLWQPREMPSGLWTICVHPNEMEDAAMRRLDEFLQSHKGSFPSPLDAASRAVPFALPDFAFGFGFLTLVQMKRLFSGRKAG